MTNQKVELPPIGVHLVVDQNKPNAVFTVFNMIWQDLPAQHIGVFLPLEEEMSDYDSIVVPKTSKLKLFRIKPLTIPREKQNPALFHSYFAQSADKLLICPLNTKSLT